MFGLRRHDRKFRARWLAATVTFGVIATAGSPSASAQTIPSDPSPTCTVPTAVFATWFQSGTPGLNGVVNPANSVAFPNTPNCSFYQWAAQMFLWLTSPAPSVYGGGGRILDSASFFDVSTPDASGNRTLLAHTPNFIRVLGVRAAQVGPGGLPVIFDRNGNMLEVERPQSVAAAQIRIRNAAGALVDVAHAERNERGMVLLRDRAGAMIAPRHALAGRPIFRAPPAGPTRVQQFLVDNLPIFIDPFGNVVEVEQGQADGSVLQAQNGSLIYYAIMVNDVYAYFLTGLKDSQIQPGNPNAQFPTTQSDLNAITTFAAGHGASFVDSDALAVEIKTSWIEASSLPNLSNYITITATVPTYNTSSGTNWVPTGQKTTQLALVGMHVVGSTAGHPELIWATFEHAGNAPNATFQYVNSGGTLTTVPQSTAGTWLFSAGNSAGPFNMAHMAESGADIAAIPPFTISPSDTIRWKAWGAAANLSPNPIDGSAAASNTEIIAINDSIAGMMPAGDVRTNYFMTGATWTIGGFAPDSSNQVGTSRLANTTMETYQQGVDNSATGGSNCFSCHTSSNPSIATTGVSHVFGAIKPLF